MPIISPSKDEKVPSPARSTPSSTRSHPATPTSADVHLRTPPQPSCAPHLGAHSGTKANEVSESAGPYLSCWGVHWGYFPTCPRFLPFLLPPKASPWYVPADRLAAWAGVSPPREDLMELSLARELPNWELSTISTAASRSRQREESLPRINAAIAWRGVPRKGQSPQGCGYRGREDPNTGPYARGAGTRRLFPPTPLGFGGPAPCELSLTPQTGRERDPSKTCFSARTGSSAVTGSNQRRGAFLPRRRDPRCKKPQRHGPHRFRCSLPRTSEVPPGSPRSSPPPSCSGGPH